MRSINAYIQESFYNNVKTNSYKYANLDKYIVDILSDLKKAVSFGEKAYRKNIQRENLSILVLCMVTFVALTKNFLYQS